MTKDASITIDTVDDVRTLGDDDIAKLTDLINVMQLEREPNDPPSPVAFIAASLRSAPDFIDVNGAFARIGDRIVGLARAVIVRTGENQHLVQAAVAVRPEHRQQGIGRRLLACLVPVCENEGRSLLVSDTSDRVPAGEAFAERLGATRGLAIQINRLLIADVDRALMQQWVDDAPKRAKGYSLLMIDGPIPEEMVGPFVELVDVMNDAPRDDLEIEDEHLTVEQLRSSETAGQAQGSERWTAIVRHDATGELAGFHDVSWNPVSPKTVGVGATGVRPAHRGHAIGKWLKAAITLRVIDERPQVADIRTGNAYSNDAMLGINTEMGYRHYKKTTIWQVSVNAVNEYLDGSTAS